MTSLAMRRRDGLRLFVERAGAEPESPQWVERTDSDKPAIRMQAPDLRTAQDCYLRHREGLSREGASPDEASIILDIAVLIDNDAREARRAWRERSEGEVGTANSLRYAGSPDGLRMLLDDIAAARVADGVTIIALADYNTIDDLLAIIAE